MKTRLIWLSVGFVLLVGVLFIWLWRNEPEMKPTAAANLTLKIGMAITHQAQ